MAPPLYADHGIPLSPRCRRPEFPHEDPGMTAGYDPSFMSGYPMSIVSDLSSTFSNLCMLAFPDRLPALAYKLLPVFTSISILPWLVSLAAVTWRATKRGRRGQPFLSCFWTNSFTFAGMGMINYLLSVPGTGGRLMLDDLPDQGGPALAPGDARVLGRISLSIRDRSPMLVGPAGLLAYGVAATVGATIPDLPAPGPGRDGPFILAVNAFWWFPATFWRRSAPKACSPSPGPGTRAAATRGSSGLKPPRCPSP